MTAFYTPKEADYLKDRQDGTTVDLYVCSDGIMRTAYERSKFETANERDGAPIKPKLIG